MRAAMKIYVQQPGSCLNFLSDTKTASICLISVLEFTMNSLLREGSISSILPSSSNVQDWCILRMPRRDSESECVYLVLEKNVHMIEWTV